MRRLFSISVVHSLPITARSISTDGRQPPNKKRKGKMGVNDRKKGITNYGVFLTRTWDQVVKLDISNGNTFWQDAVEKEMADLIHHNCFKFMASNFKPTEEYQYALLNLIFEVKDYLTRKARLVIMGNVVDPRGLSTRATAVKGISVRLLSIIVNRYKLK